MRIRLAAILAAVALIGVAAWLVVRVSASSAARQSDAQVLAPGSPRTAPGVLSQVRGRNVLRGRVLDANGPVAGASILVTSDADEEAFSSVHCAGEPNSSIFECHCAPVSDLIEWRFADGRGEAIPVANATTDAEGRFEVAGLEPGAYAVWAEAGELRAMEAGVDANRSVDLQMRPGIRFAGITRSDDGTPIAGATVAAIHRLHSRFFTTQSDGEGHFALGPLPDGSYQVIASSPGRIPVRRSPSEDMELELAPSRRIEGKVVRDGRPASGIIVRTRVHCSHAETRSGPDGQFVLERLLPEETTLSAFSGELGGFTKVDLEPSDRADVVIELRRGGTLVGDVRSEAGEPVSGARLRVESYDPDVETEETTGTDGAFKVTGLPPADYSMWLHPPPGCVEPGRRDANVSTDETVQVHYVLLRAAKVAGTVQDEQGKPVAGAVIFGHRIRDGRGLAADWDAEGSVRTKTDRLGRFAFEGSPPGRLKLEIRANGFLDRVLEVAGPGEVNVTLARGGTLEVEVLDDSGIPVSGADLSATTPHPEGGDPVLAQASTDAQGRGSFTGLRSGRYRVVAQVVLRDGEPGLVPRVRTVAADAVVDASKSTSVRLRFEAGLTITGTTIDAATGRALAGVKVIAEDQINDPPIDRGNYAHYPRAGGIARSDALGHFEIRQLRSNPHELIWSLNGYDFPDEIVVMPGEGRPLLLKLSRSPVLKGRVVDERGVPIGAFTVERRDFETKEGRFEVELQDPGPQTIQIQSEGFATFLKDVTVEKGRDIDLGDVRLSRGRSVKVTVLAASGQPVGSATVRVGVPSTAHRLLLESEVSRDKTRTDGSVTLESVPSIPLHVLVESDSMPSALVPLALDAHELKVILGRGGKISGSVRNAAGEPVRNVVVTASCFALFRHTKTDEDGRFAIGGLPADDYTVELGEEVADGNVGLSWRNVALADEGVAQVDFRETRGATLILTGPCWRRFLVAGGVAFTRADIERAKRQQFEPGHRRDGSSVFRGLAAGTYTAVCATNFRRADVPKRASVIPIEIGSSDVEVVVPEPSVAVE